MKHVKREFYRTAHKKCENMCCLKIEENLPKARRVNKNEHFYHLHGKWKQQRRVNKANTHTSIHTEQSQPREYSSWMRLKAKVMDKIKNGRANRTNNKNRKIKLEKNYYDEEQNANVQKCKQNTQMEYLKLFCASYIHCLCYCLFCLPLTRMLPICFCVRIRIICDFSKNELINRIHGNILTVSVFGWCSCLSIICWSPF